MIAGGGVAGLAASIALARSGLSCLILEASRQRGEADRGDALQAYALQTLEQWGAAEDIFNAGALRVSRFKVLDSHGRMLRDLDTRVHVSPDTDLVFLRHPFIEAALEAAALRTGRVRLDRGVRCNSLLNEAGRVIGVRTSNGDFHAPLTVIAAGAFTPLLADGFPAAFRKRYKAAYYSMRCGNIPFHRDAGVYAIGSAGVLVTAPLPNDETRVVLQLSPPFAIPTGDELDRRVRACGLAVEGHLPVVGAHLYHAASYMAQSMWRPGAILIGDSAHVTHPVGGQGMNMAIRGARFLEEALTRVGDLSASALDQACRQYDQAVQRTARRTLWLTHRLGLIAANRLLRSFGRHSLRLVPESRLTAAILSRICWGT